MGKKVITFGLSPREIGKAIRELEAYRQDFIEKTETFRQRVADKIAELAESGFKGAIIDDIINGEQRTAQVQVSVENGEGVTLVIANGEDAVWAEFGTGVYYNKPAGRSRHPVGEELGFTIGGYGQTRGTREVWGFYEGGELRLTHGAPTTMPLYKALQTVRDEIESIAKEVYG